MFPRPCIKTLFQKLLLKFSLEIPSLISELPSEIEENPGCRQTTHAIKNTKIAGSEQQKLWRPYFLI